MTNDYDDELRLAAWHYYLSEHGRGTFPSSAPDTQIEFEYGWDAARDNVAGIDWLTSSEDFKAGFLAQLETDE